MDFSDFTIWQHLSACFVISIWCLIVVGLCNLPFIVISFLQNLSDSDDL